MPQPLDYMPQTYRRATSVWAVMAGGLVVLAAGVALVGWAGGRWDAGLFRFAAVAGAVWGAAAVFVWRRGGVREC